MKVKKDAIGKEIMKSYAKGGAADACPLETSDIGLNLKNRNNTIKEYGYGPHNPDEPSNDFGEQKPRCRTRALPRASDNEDARTYGTTAEV